MMAVVVVGGGGGRLVVVVVVGINFYTWTPPEPMYGLREFKSKTPYF